MLIIGYKDWLHSEYRRNVGRADTMERIVMNEVTTQSKQNGEEGAPLTTMQQEVRVLA
jgi:hypothetical protein